MESEKIVEVLKQHLPVVDSEPFILYSEPVYEDGFCFVSCTIKVDTVAQIGTEKVAIGSSDDVVKDASFRVLMDAIDMWIAAWTAFRDIQTLQKLNQGSIYGRN